ncbi:MAG TPA: DUF1501 domain-containing protein [Polyangiaceae bacterium]|nr:DUF1501 domain-containing protein [Polyangiaceae bacterium]
MTEYKLSRRAFSFATALGPLALFAPGAAFAAGAAPKTKTLVCVFLRGGLDGLSAVIPYADDAYAKQRRQTVIAAPGSGKQAGLKLDERFAAHPALAPLMPAWQAGQLGFIHAVGSPHATRSHFEAQDHFEWGGLSAGDGKGWLARAHAARGAAGSNLGSVALANATPLAFRGQPGVVAARSLDRFGLQAPPKLQPQLEAAFQRVYAAQGDAIARAGASALDVAKRLRGIPRAASKKYPSQSKGLSDVAALIRANVGLEVAWVDAGGWDTHQGQAGRLDRNLGLLARGLAAFREDIGDRMEHTLVLVMTEFGRTVKENGTGGTDHGHGSVMFALGGNVHGKKVHGVWPSLSEDKLHEGRDLAVTTDFRDVFAEVLQTQLGVTNPSAVLGGHRATKQFSLLRT